MQRSIILASALLSAVNAIPVSQGWSAMPSTAPTPTPAGAGSYPMKSGNPFSFPLSNGFDGTLSGSALIDTEVQAHGTEPNGGAPTLSADDLTSIQLIAFNEIFEVAFFTDLLYNVTNGVSGFAATDNGLTKQALVAIQAQEELHADNANAILKGNGKNAIKACQYKFPTTTLADALALAKTFTDVVMGTLQDVQLHLATNGAAGVVPIIGSVIGQEGEQTGFFRTSANLIPSSKPFLTRAAREFAFSALNQLFVVPGSCPNANEISLPVFAPLAVTTPTIAAADQTLSFSTTLNSTYSASSLSSMSLVYINGQNTPIVEKITNVAAGAGGATTFQASFPYSENVMDGLTIAALVSGSGPFASAGDVAKATIAGPGLIEIN